MTEASKSQLGGPFTNQSLGSQELPSVFSPHKPPGRFDASDTALALTLRILDLAPGGVLISNHRGEIVMVNGHLESLSGYRSEELLGQRVEILVPTALRTKHEIFRQHFSNAGQSRMAGTGRELTLLRKDNSEVPVEISIGPVGEKGLQFSVVADISERKKMRAELERAQLQILASDRMATIGRMAGGIAHEISNPIGIIHALASNLMEMVNDGGATLEDVRHEGARIVQTAERISKIVTSMRFLAREGSSDSVRIVSISKIVDTTLEFCNQRIRKESVDLIWRMPSEPVLVSCREVQIAQVLLNLLQNALDALERCQEKWIEIELETTGREVLVNVIDSGPGVPPEIASNIMEPFFTTKPVGKGTGLGLSISRAIAEEHGGKLVCGKKKGRTCFSLVLPAFTEVTAPCI